jgi:hypothetical protein
VTDWSPTVAVRVDVPGLTMKSVTVSDLPPAEKVSQPVWLNVPRTNGVEDFG